MVIKTVKIRKIVVVAHAIASKLINLLNISKKNELPWVQVKKSTNISS